MCLSIEKSSTLTFIAKPNKFISQKSINNLIALMPESRVKLCNKFLNCISIEFLLDKLIVCKVFKNGTLQITGCKSKAHPIAVCKDVQNVFECSFIVTLAMENIYTELGFNVNKLALYKSWKNHHHDCSPPIGTYTAVRLRFVVKNYVKQDYMITSQSVLHFHSNSNVPSVVNIAVFHNGKVLFSGLNKDCIKSAMIELKNIVFGNNDIRDDEIKTL